MRKHWKKVFLGLFVICLLIVSFWYGGNAPGLQGFSVNETDVATQQNKNQQSVEENQRSADSSDEQQDSIKEKASNIFEPFFMNIKLKKKASTSSDNMQTSKKAQKNANKAVKKEEKKKKKSSSDKKTNNKKNNKTVTKEEDTSSTETDSSSEEEKNTAGFTTEDFDTENTTENVTDDNKDTDKATEATTETTTETTMEQATETAPKDIVTISISCKTLLKQMDLLKASKKSHVPKDGVVLKSTTVEIEDGDTVFDVLQKATKANKIHLEFNYTPAYKSHYIEGIHNIYEFDAGNLSGWMYCVNGEFTGVGCSFYEVEAGDEIQWVYTCDLGKDVGDSLE